MSDLIKSYQGWRALDERQGTAAMSGFNMPNRNDVTRLKIRHD